MRSLQAKADQIGQRALKIRMRRLEEQLGRLLPDATVESSVGSIEVGGRRLRRRWLMDPMLRFIGRLAQ